MMTKAQTTGLLSAMSGSAFPSPASPIETLVYDGQSLALINGVSTRPDNIRAARMDPAGVLMVKGLRNTDGRGATCKGRKAAATIRRCPRPDTDRLWSKATGQWRFGPPIPCAAGTRGRGFLTRAS